MEGRGKEWGGPPLCCCRCCFNCRLVSGQLLIHSSSATTTNRGHTRQSRAEPGRAVWDTGRQRRASQTPLKKKPGDQFLHCRYGNRAVSIECLTAFSLSLHLHLISPSSLPLSLSLSLLSLSPSAAVLPHSSSSSSSHLLLWNKSTAVSASLRASALAIKHATVLRLQPFVWLLIQR